MWRGEGAENARKYREIDVPSKTLVKTEVVVTETPFYDHKVDEEFIFISSEEEDTIRKMQYVMSTLNCQKKR